MTSIPSLVASAVEPVRVALYARISEDDRKDVLGVKRQIHDDRLLAEAKGWQVVGEYVDNDIRASGAPVLRPQFERLLADVQAGLVDAIIASEPERITRRPRELEKILEVCQSAGVKYIAYVDSSEVNVETGDGILMARIRAAIAADDADKIGKRVKAKKRELARDGKPSGGPRAFGWTPGYAAIIPGEAAMIREAVDRVLDGEPVNAIASDWNEAGLVTSNGRTWRPGALAEMIKHPRIAGLRSHNGVIVRDAVWDPIIDVATRDRLLAELAPRKSRDGRMKGKRLLTGLLRCGRCRGWLVAGSNNGDRSYQCQVFVGVTGGCSLSIKAEPIEERLRDAALERLGDGLLEVLKAQRCGAVDPADTDRIAALEARLDELADMLGADEIDRAGYGRARKKADDELQPIRRRVERQRTRSAIDGFLDGTDPIVDRWEAATIPVQRAVLAAMLTEVLVLPAVRGRGRIDFGRIDPTWIH